MNKQGPVTPIATQGVRVGSRGTLGTMQVIYSVFGLVAEIAGKRNAMVFKMRLDSYSIVVLYTVFIK